MEKTYVGELIRAEIKKQKLTNGFVIERLKQSGTEMSDTKFSNKIYGVRERFTQVEVDIVNVALGTSFSND